MPIFDLFKKRKPRRLDDRSPIPECVGPITARQAFEIAGEAARKLDGRARLTHAQSDLNIQPDGRAHVWEFLFYFPSIRSTGILSVTPRDEEEPPDEPVLCLRRRVKPLPFPIDHATLKPELPWDFHDSPEAVAALAGQGVDFISGPTDLSIESHIRPSGEVVWRTFFYDREVATPFA